ncbi:hypothetical protein D3C86_1194900 [compost metagenome]
MDDRRHQVGLGPGALDVPVRAAEGQGAPRVGIDPIDEHEDRQRPKARHAPQHLRQRHATRPVRPLGFEDHHVGHPAIEGLPERRGLPEAHDDAAGLRQIRREPRRERLGTAEHHHGRRRLRRRGQNRLDGFEQRGQGQVLLEQASRPEAHGFEPRREARVVTNEQHRHLRLAEQGDEIVALGLVQPGRIEEDHRRRIRPQTPVSCAQVRGHHEPRPEIGQGLSQGVVERIRQALDQQHRAHGHGRGLGIGGVEGVSAPRRQRKAECQRNLLGHGFPVQGMEQQLLGSELAEELARKGRPEALLQAIEDGQGIEHQLGPDLGQEALGRVVDAVVVDDEQRVAAAREDAQRLIPAVGGREQRVDQACLQPSRQLFRQSDRQDPQHQARVPRPSSWRPHQRRDASW